MGGVADGLRHAAYPHLAGVGGHEAQHDLHERRLARPVLAEQADDLPRCNGEVDTITVQPASSAKERAPSTKL